MSSEKSPPRETVEQQDQSIKARKHQLFEEPDRADGAVKPFKVYLRDTPPAPLSGGVKATLWAVGAVVVLLLLAALFGGGRRSTPRTRSAALHGPAAQPAARTPAPAPPIA